MARPAKLKVYCTAVGFYDALVAAPSQKAALKAWGTSTDLFGAGRATVVDDPEQQAEALATPGQVIKRPRGGDPETLVAAMEAEDRAERSQRPATRATKKRPVAPPPPVAPPVAPPPDRSALDAAGQALSDARHELQRTLDDITAERHALDDRETAVRSKGETLIAKLEAEHDRAQTAYERALSTRR